MKKRITQLRLFALALLAMVHSPIQAQTGACFDNDLCVFVGNPLGRAGDVIYYNKGIWEIAEDLAVDFKVHGLPVLGDWNGDGFDTPGFFDKGEWFLSDSWNGQIDYVVAFDADGIPVVGDWDGDGIDTVGVYESGIWYLTNSLVSEPFILKPIEFGSESDLPVTGDWDNDGRDTLGIYSPSGVFSLTNELDNNDPFFRNPRVPLPDAQPISGNLTGQGDTVGRVIVRSKVGERGTIIIIPSSN